MTDREYFLKVRALLRELVDRGRNEFKPLLSETERRRRNQVQRDAARNVETAR